jgi:hypothetical protein
VVLGELATPVLLTTLVLSDGGRPVACYRWVDVSDRLGVCAIVNPSSCRENILNLLFPARPATGGNGQAQQLSRTMLFLIVKLVLFSGRMAGALASALAFHAFDNPPPPRRRGGAVVAGLDALCVLPWFGPTSASTRG